MKAIVQDHYGSEEVLRLREVDKPAIGDGDVLVRAFAAADGLEAKAEFRFPARGKKGPQVDELKPGCLVNNRGGKKLDSRSKTFSGLSAAREKGVTSRMWQ